MGERSRISLDTSWARKPAAQAVREVIIMGLLGPVIDYYVEPQTEGADLFDSLKPPVLFASNHQSHMDTPTILKSMPGPWRRKTAALAAADYFFRNRLVATLVSLSFATVPIERKGGGTRENNQRIERLLQENWNLLIYPEGTRSRSGDIGTLRSGVAAIALEHGVPIVPIHVGGTHDAMPVGRAWPKRHPVTVRFGTPIEPSPADDRKSLMAELTAALTSMRAESAT
jgi:1-acyl-sn-glycerol-3-phosphate acyltransferase